MKSKQFYFLTLMLGMIVVSFPACDGILDDIYDKPKDIESGFGIDANGYNYVTFDARDYANWIYISFHSQTIQTLTITDDMQEPADWDLAVHRYDAKTNEGLVLETGFSDISSLIASGSMPKGDYVSDIPTTDKIVIDISQMMQGILVYAESDYNPELSKWLNVDTSQMPPIYTPSNKAYILKLKDGTAAALYLHSFMNSENVKGYMNIRFVYPLKI